MSLLGLGCGVETASAGEIGSNRGSQQVLPPSAESGAADLSTVNFDLGKVRGSTLDTAATSERTRAQLRRILDEPSVRKELIRMSQAAEKSDRDDTTRISNPSTLSVERNRTNAIMVFPGVPLDNPLADGNSRVLGVTQIQAVRASRDGISQSVIGSNHIHDDLANRWGHSASPRAVMSELEKRGVSPVVAAAIGAVLTIPKEYLVDLHPSAADMVVTYHD